MDTVVVYIVGILVVAVGVLLSIVLHEAGHFVPAKLFKVHVGQFMVGFGKTLWSRTYKGTQFGIKALPLGGYISMSGMYPPIAPGGKARTASTGFFQTLVQDARTASADTIQDGKEENVFYKLAIWKRIIIMLGGPVMNLIIAIVLYAIILCGLGTGVATTTLASVSACLQTTSSTSTTCTSSDPVSPAAAAGIKPGDTIESIDGTTVSTFDQLSAIIQKSAGKTIPVVVKRGNETLHLTVTPVLTTRDVTTSTGATETNWDGTTLTHKVGFVGIGPLTAFQTQSFDVVLPSVWANTTGVGKIVLDLPQRLVGVANAAFGSGKRDPNGPIGLVGVGRLAGQIATAHTATIPERISGLLQLLASLNIALFVFNLIPLMPLDGGHIIGALWEGLKKGFAKIFHRRDPGPVDTAKVVPLTFAVVIVLGAMSLLLFYADIVKPVSLQ